MDNNYFYLASKESSLMDSEYRYKINKPKISVNGKQGNKTTMFENSEYYSDKIGISSIFFGKYIGNKISCPSNFDNTKKCLTFKGEYTQEQIEQYLKDFLKIYILCSSCDYPETDLTLDDKKNIISTCRSCGNNSSIDKKYMDKTYDYIKKNINIKT